QHERVAPHISWNEHGLPYRMVLLRYCRMIGRESPSCSLAMDTQSLHLSIDFVLFHLGDVMAHIVDQRHIFRSSLASKDCCESLAHSIHQQLAVGPGKVRPAGHCREVRLPHVGLQGQTGQLTVYQVEAKVLLLRLRELDE